MNRIARAPWKFNWRRFESAAKATCLSTSVGSSRGLVVAGPVAHRYLEGDWVAILSEEHGREYFWNRVSGATCWDCPAHPSNFSSGQNAPEAMSLARSAPTGKALLLESASAPVAVRAREFPEGWCAVYSTAEGREYFWHRPSGTTTWVCPTATSPLRPFDSSISSSQTVSSAVVMSIPAEGSALAAFVRDCRSLRKIVSNMLNEYSNGEVLQQDDARILLELLEYHPDREAKFGSGVQSIKVDQSLHCSESRCFWLVRVDDTAEDFSARKCLEAFRQSVEQRPCVSTESAVEHV